MKKIFAILSELSRRRTAELVIVMILMLGAATAQTTLITQTKPFIENIISIDRLNESSGQISHTIKACITIATLAVVSGILRLITSWKSGEVGTKIALDLYRKSYNLMLNDSYENHKKRNTADQMGDLRQIDAFVAGVIAPIIQIIGSAATILGATYAALIVNTEGTGLALTIVGTLYILFTLTIRKRLKNLGISIVSKGRKEIRLQQETLGNIRDIILESSQSIHTDEFMNNATNMRMVGIETGFLQTAPRYVIEMLGFVVFAGLGFLATINGKINSTNGIAQIGALALAYQIALPSIQQLFSCWSSYRSSIASIETVYALTNRKTEGNYNLGQEKQMMTDEKNINNWKLLEINDLSFSYDYDTKDRINIINNLSITIRRGENIGIIGETGGGKSTLVDIIMGLLKPSKGDVKVDGNLINKNNLLCNQWRYQVSHVPQNIFLIDGSIAMNIAMTKNKNDIDWVNINKCIKLADLENMINSTKEGVNTNVGERGSRLSGGQRQRVGIARALYKRKSILILDEATSALDYITEAKIIEAINSLKHKPTIIYIAHRIQTLRKCDCIYIIKDGKISNEGKYDSLSINDNYFKKLLSAKS